jgi:Zn-dependent M28 family amino/carboxypeptidase
VCDAPGADDDGSGVSAMMEMARVMAKHSLDATIKFMAVDGEEEGLYGSTHFAQDAKAQGMDIEGMLDNDIIGSSTGDAGQREPHVIRLFAEGVPTAETPQQAATRINVGGENDSTSRQLARYAKEVGENGATDMTIRLIWRRDRYLRGGDQIPFLEQGWPAVRSPSPTRTSPTSTRTSASRTACSSATCRSSWTSRSPTAWRASTR